MGHCSVVEFLLTSCVDVLRSSGAWDTHQLDGGRNRQTSVLGACGVHVESAAVEHAWLEATALGPNVVAWKEILPNQSRKCHHPQVPRSGFLFGGIVSGASPWSSSCRSYEM